MKPWFKAKLFLTLIVLLWIWEIVTKPWIIPLTIVALTLKKEDEAYKRYVLNLWIKDDQNINAQLGGNPDVTVSDKVGYLANSEGQHKGVRPSKTAQAVQWVINKMFEIAVGQQNHCQESYEEDEQHYSYFFN